MDDKIQNDVDAATQLRTPDDRHKVGYVDAMDATHNTRASSSGLGHPERTLSTTITSSTRPQTDSALEYHHIMMGLVCTMFVMALWAWLGMSHQRNDAIELNAISTTISPNASPWYELTAIPQIGPSMAMAIVDYRTKQFQYDPDADVQNSDNLDDTYDQGFDPDTNRGTSHTMMHTSDRYKPTHHAVFKNASDLDHVTGIGPATVRIIAPFMHFDEHAKR